MDGEEKVAVLQRVEDIVKEGRGRGNEMAQWHELGEWWMKELRVSVPRLDNS